METPFRILFVCTGNIVRSPLAEAIFLTYAQRANVEDDYILDSAGTTAFHVGEQADRRMRKTAEKYGYSYSHFSKKFKQAHFNQFDLARLSQNEDDTHKIRLMREFDPLADEDMSVPDPWYGSMADFEESFEIVERSCKELFQILENKKEQDASF